MMKGMVKLNIQIEANNLDSNARNRELNFQLELPSKCPRCSIAYASPPNFVGYFQSQFGEIDLYALFFCPACEKSFFAVYRTDELYSQNCGRIISLYPNFSNPCAFSDELVALSPKFVEIYHQAEKAENSDLTELCGIGYRKALEFLVKDYAISNHPEFKEQIESFPLSKCITDYIDNEKIKTLAKASAWLGNDETHYVRIHQNYKIQDLKRFIKATVAYIEYELSFTEAFDFLHNSQ